MFDYVTTTQQRTQNQTVEAPRCRLSDTGNCPRRKGTQICFKYNLLSGRGLLNLMIWVIIDESFEPIRRSRETLIVFVSRVLPERLTQGGTDRRFKEWDACVRLIHSTAASSASVGPLTHRTPAQS
ncbi:hypothetical protein WMY93_017952 [Mugilogobius chulae]|uniref:Uncharacterized protein n=1 Tax=Mugilogobius chulae TaxID=88201 RepID=A0AAW0NIS3_9GOBI